MESSRSTDLPEGILCMLFTARARPVSDPVLDVRDRARCQAVNTHWRRCLCSLPLEQLDVQVSSDQGFTDPSAAWVERSQVPARALHVEDPSLPQTWCYVPPAPQPIGVSVDTPSLQTACHLLQQSRKVLQKLRLDVHLRAMQRFLRQLHMLPQLQRLSLRVEYPSVGSMDASLLCHLPSLQELIVQGYESVEIKGGALAPSLTSLDASGCDRLDLDATLPHLQTLAVPDWARIAGDLPALSQLHSGFATTGVEFIEHLELNAALPRLESLWLEDDRGGRVLLTGAQLALPGLTCLHLLGFGYGTPLTAEVAFQRMPALQELELYDAALQGAVAGLSVLWRLTSLRAVVGGAQSAGTVDSLLRAAPPSLRRLDLRAKMGRSACLLGHGIPDALASCTQLAEVNGLPYSEAMALLQAGAVEELCM